MGLIFVDVTAPPAPTDSEATMQLTLDATALDGIDPADLVVSHHDGGEWAALETTVVWSGGDRVVIETTTPGFSLFAVAPAVQQTIQDEGAGTPDDTTLDVGTATPGSAGETATAVPEVEEPAGFDPLPLVLLAVVVIALLLVAVHRRS